MRVIESVVDATASELKTIAFENLRLANPALTVEQVAVLDLGGGGWDVALGNRTTACDRTIIPSLQSQFRLKE
jgi:hypothetical protein